MRRPVRFSGRTRPGDPVNLVADVAPAPRALGFVAGGRARQGDARPTSTGFRKSRRALNHARRLHAHRRPRLDRGLQLSAQPGSRASRPSGLWRRSRALRRQRRHGRAGRRVRTVARAGADQVFRCSTGGYSSLRLARACTLGNVPTATADLQRAGIDVVFEAAQFYGWRFPIATLAWTPDFQRRQLAGVLVAAVVAPRDRLPRAGDHQAAS